MPDIKNRLGIILKSTALIFGYTLLYVVPRGLIKGAFETEADVPVEYTEWQLLIVKIFFIIGASANVLSMLFMFINRTNYQANLKVVLPAAAIIIILLEVFFI
jgi:hypothetical protein